MSNRVRVHSLEVRNEALRLWREGIALRQIAARLCVPYQSVRYWVEYTLSQQGPKPKKVTKNGSGVIAPAPYRRGYVYGAGY